MSCPVMAVGPEGADHQSRRAARSVNSVRIEVRLLPELALRDANPCPLGCRLSGVKPTCSSHLQTTRVTRLGHRQVIPRSRRYGTSTRDHSGLMLAARITLAHYVLF